MNQLGCKARTKTKESKKPGLTKIKLVATKLHKQVHTKFINFKNNLIQIL